MEAELLDEGLSLEMVLATTIDESLSQPNQGSQRSQASVHNLYNIFIFTLNLFYTAHMGWWGSCDTHHTARGNRLCIHAYMIL